MRRNFSTVLLIVLSVLGVWIVQYSTRWGAALSDDSFQYVSAARNLVAGEGLGYRWGDGTVQPLVNYPPVFSMALAAPGFFGAEALSAARWLNAVSFGLLIFLFGTTIGRETGTQGWPVLAALLALTSPVLIEAHAWALSEPLYLLLGLGGLALIAQYRQRPHAAVLIGAAAAIGMAWLTRYVGAALVASGSVLLLLRGPRPKPERLRAAAVFSLLAAAPMGIWLARVAALSATFGGRSLIWNPIRINQVRRAVNVLFIWLLPGRFVHGNEWPLLIGAVLLAGAALAAWLWARGRRSAGSPARTPFELAWALGLYIVFYLGILVFALTFYDPRIPFDNRLFSPLYLSGLGLLVLLLSRLWRTGHLFFKAAVLAVAVSLLALNGLRAADLISHLHTQGAGYASRGWHSSPTLEALDAEGEAPVFSNAYPAIHLWLDRPAYPIDDLALMRRNIAEDGALLVVFNSIPVELYGVSLEELTRGLSPPEVFRDGAIYRADELGQ